MQLIAITDIHGHEHFNNTIAKTISNADIVLIGGDITNFGDEKEADPILQNINQLNNQILAIPGNCDQQSVNKLLISKEINLHRERRIIENITFYGLGGSSKTPFHTPQEYTEFEIEEILSGFEKTDTRFHILLSHSPPAKTKVDKTFIGLHVGSKAIRDFIEKFRLDLVICGHIHEARGVDTINNTLIINPGPFPKHYAIIDLNEKIEYELH
ncbi:metallophosphoesterase [candidate division WOR-3 bacterium]|jgi:putative phosphoesterase|nr:metallophosphoesterase [candidate division WOR-3 bacterium]